MNRNRLSTLLWIIDVLSRHERVSKKKFDYYWCNSQYSEGEESIPRRTFYNYLKDIDEMFGIEIRFDNTTKEYYIHDDGYSDRFDSTLNNWLLNAMSTHGALSNMKDLSSRIFLENVPSARVFLSPILEAIKRSTPVTFDYNSYDRVNPKKEICLDPYFLNIFRQRWYVTGLNHNDSKIKTYALDRMSNLNLTSDFFEYPSDFDALQYTNDSFGVIFTQGETHEIVLRVNSRQAKYLRAVPLHHSQKEEENDGVIRFRYKLKLTPDFVGELLSMGPNVTVEQPKELRYMILNSLKEMMSNYCLEAGGNPTEDAVL